MKRELPRLEKTTKPLRGRPFQPGNPGRPLGSKNKTTRLVEQLMADDAETVAKKAVELARDGNVNCIELILKRVSPHRNGRPIDFNLPAITSAQDLIPALAAITEGINNGSLTPEEASQLTAIVEKNSNVITTRDLAVRLDAIELWIKGRIP